MGLCKSSEYTEEDQKILFQVKKVFHPHQNITQQDKDFLFSTIKKAKFKISRDLYLPLFYVLLNFQTVTRVEMDDKIANLANCPNIELDEVVKTCLDKDCSRAPRPQHPLEINEDDDMAIDQEAWNRQIH